MEVGHVGQDDLPFDLLVQPIRHEPQNMGLHEGLTLVVSSVRNIADKQSFELTVKNHSKKEADGQMYTGGEKNARGSLGGINVLIS